MSLRKLESVQALRGIAAVLVVLYHATDIYGEHFKGEYLFRIFKSGASGVDIFFVLSGFIIFYIHARDLQVPSKGKEFLRKRLTRIFPIYWVAYAYKVLTLKGIGSGRPDTFSAQDVVAGGLLWPVPVQHRILKVSWTLTHELLFYALFLTAILTRKSILKPTLIVWSILILAAMPLHLDDSNWLAVALSSRNLGFIFGCFVAWQLKRRVDSAVQSYMLVIAGLAVFTTTWIFDHALADFAGCWYALGSAFALYGLLRLEEHGHFKVPKLSLFLGDASYSIYLAHLGVVNAVLIFLAHRVHAPSLSIPQMLLVPLAGVSAGCLLYVLIERPLLNLLRPRKPVPA